ncbi:hypothetical protein NLI96_g3995 [Meripilus lineatus]|uniref:Uncharacterized protein n=1 Tax=Meripilus lineatus TaxID=2056292 RepID=A0AAD5YKH9_9APHY|nr:hypothetical protein NLI96_g3995 [Physisporinus lineatus]
MKTSFLRHLGSSATNADSIMPRSGRGGWDSKFLHASTTKGYVLESLVVMASYPSGYAYEANMAVLTPTRLREFL